MLGELEYGDSQPSYTVHTTGGMETYIPLSLCYATWHPVTTTIHNWWKGNIYSVTVLGDLALTYSSAHVSIRVLGNTANMVRFIALLASYREYAGCEMHHASAGGDRLIVMTALAVADYDGASVLDGFDKTFS